MTLFSINIGNIFNIYVKNIARIQSKQFNPNSVCFQVTQSVFYFIRGRLFRTRGHFGTHILSGFLKSDKFQYDSFELKCLSKDIQKSNNII